MADMGYVQMSSIDTAIALASIPDGANAAILTAETQAIRWRGDGTTTAPTTTVGNPIAVNSPYLLRYVNLATVKVIGQVAGGKLNIEYLTLANGEV